MISASNCEPAFVKDGFNNWKKATETNACFRKHERSDGHKAAVERRVTLPDCTKYMGKVPSTVHAKENKMNRQMLM